MRSLISQPNNDQSHDSQLIEAPFQGFILEIYYHLSVTEEIEGPHIEETFAVRSRKRSCMRRAARA